MGHKLCRIYIFLLSIVFLVLGIITLWTIPRPGVPLSLSVTLVLVYLALGISELIRLQRKTRSKNHDSKKEPADRQR